MILTVGGRYEIYSPSNKKKDYIVFPIKNRMEGTLFGLIYDDRIRVKKSPVKKFPAINSPKLTACAKKYPDKKSLLDNLWPATFWPETLLADTMRTV